MCIDYLQQLQKMEEKRISILSDRLADYADAERHVQSNVIACLDNITTVAKAVNSAQVCRQFFMEEPLIQTYS